MKNLQELKAETNQGTFSIGYFENKEQAIEAAQIDKDSENGIYCLSGIVKYVFDEDRLYLK